MWKTRAGDIGMAKCGCGRLPVRCGSLLEQSSPCQIPQNWGASCRFRRIIRYAQTQNPGRRGHGVRVSLALIAPAPLLGQNAEISGFISDPSGLAVPAARVVVESNQTGARRTVLSNQLGQYTLAALPPAAYQVSIEANGFKTTRQSGIVLEVDQRARLDFTLTIGSATETITVDASAPLLNVSDGSVSTVIGNRFIENMPLNGRSFNSLINLTPGVALTIANGLEQGQFSVNGQRPDANYFMVDGVSANLGNAGGGGLLSRAAPASCIDQCLGRNEQSCLARCARGVSHSDLHLCTGIRANSGAQYWW